jgi:hypothetical protein
MVHLADGGYWDNSGVVTALEWLREAAGVLEARNILVIQIAPAVLDRPSIHDRAWVWQLTAPLTGLLSVRTAAQQARNAVEIEAFRAAWQSAPGKRLEFVTIGDRGTGPSLGWHISRRERCEVEDQWWNRYVNASDPALATIESILGPRHAGARDAAKDCAQ